jgi:catechol 2,3-dioxygenase-like lactoylglutathione lyase family enzyme
MKLSKKMNYVHHVGLVCTDLDRSIYFYHDILGFEFQNEPTGWFEGPELAQGVGVPGAKLRQVSLWVDKTTTFELIEYANRPADSVKPAPNNNLGAAHVCFHVDDIHQTKKELEAQGVKFNSDVNVVDEGPLAGWRWCYFSDPDGLVLELIQWDYYDKEQHEAAAQEYLKHRPALASLKPLF